MDDRFPWVNLKIEGQDYPILPTALFVTVPIWARETIEEPVEPYHGIWERLSAIVDAIYAGHDADDDGDTWWKPSEELLALAALQGDLRRQAFRRVPNPEYDAERAQEWDTAHPGRRPVFSQTIVIGDHPPGG